MLFDAKSRQADKLQDLGHSASWWILLDRIDTEYLGINGVGIFKKE